MKKRVKPLKKREKKDLPKLKKPKAITQSNHIKKNMVMKIACLLFLLLPSQALTFLVPQSSGLLRRSGSSVGSRLARAPSPLRASASTSPIIVTGNNLDLTPALKEFSEAKMASATSLLPNVQSATLHLTVSRNKSSPSNACVAEATVTLGGGVVVRGKGKGDDMYQVVGKVGRKVKNKLGRYKERR